MNLALIGLTLGSDLPVQTAVVFILVALTGPKGITVAELVERLKRLRLDLPPSTLQRSLQRLGAGAGREVSNVGRGLGVITKATDPNEPRAYRYFLTKTGHGVASEILPGLPAVIA